MKISFVKSPFEAIEKLGEKELLVIPFKSWKQHLLNPSIGEMGSIVSEEGVRPLSHEDLVKLLDLHLLEREERNNKSESGEVFLLPSGLINESFYEIAERIIKSKYFKEGVVKGLRIIESMLKNDLVVVSQSYDSPDAASKMKEVIEAFVSGIEDEGLVEVEKEKEKTYKKLIEEMEKEKYGGIQKPEVLVIAREVNGEIDEEDFIRNPLPEPLRNLESRYGTFRTKNGKEVLLSLLGKGDLQGKLENSVSRSPNFSLYQEVNRIAITDRVYISPLIFEIESPDKSRRTKAVIGLPMVVLEAVNVESSVNLLGVSVEPSKIYTSDYRRKLTKVSISDEVFLSRVRYAKRENVEAKHSSGGLIEVTIRDFTDLEIDDLHGKCKTELTVDENGTLDYVGISCQAGVYYPDGEKEFLEKMKDWGIGRKKFLLSGFIEDWYEYDKRNKVEKVLIKELSPEEIEKINPLSRSIAQHITRKIRRITLISSREKNSGVEEEEEINTRDTEEAVRLILEKGLTEEKHQEAMKYLSLVKDLCFSSGVEASPIKHPLKQIASSWSEEEKLSRFLALEILGIDPKKLEGRSKSLKEVVKASILSMPLVDEYEFYKMKEEIERAFEKYLETENISPEMIEILVRSYKPDPYYKRAKVLVIVDDKWAKVYVRSRKRGEDGFKAVKYVNIEAGGLSIKIREEQ